MPQYGHSYVLLLGGESTALQQTELKDGITI